jgi:Predicted Zn-dependent protease (DUF2268)
MRIEPPGDLTVADQQLIQQIADTAEADVRLLIPQLPDPITLAVLIGGRYVIPATGDGGVSLARGKIAWAVDASRPGGIAGVAGRLLRFALFHELHHQARGWYVEGAPARESLMDAAVAEGLASAFARDAAGHEAPWAAYPADAARWVSELRELPPDADYRQWMVEHPDGRRWIGYRAGTFIADQASAASGRTAAQLVTMPTDEVLALAESTSPTGITGS